jgi:hypothetical protein
MPKRSRTHGRPPPHQQSPRADKGGPESFIPAFTCPRPYTRRSGRRPFGRGAKSTIWSWRGLKWHFGSGDGGVERSGRSSRRVPSHACPSQCRSRFWSRS